MWCSELLVLDEYGMRGEAGEPSLAGGERVGHAAGVLEQPAGLVVRDLRAAHGFYARTLGLRCRRVRSSWFLLDVRCRLHLAPPDGEGLATPPERLAVTLQVPDLAAALRALLARHVRVRQLEPDGSEREVLSLDASAAARLDGVFVDDPDGHRLQLLQAGHGARGVAP